MELHDIEIVGLHPRKALLDPRHDVVAREDVYTPLSARRRWSANQTAAFARQIIFSAPMLPKVVTCSPVRPSSRFAIAILVPPSGQIGSMLDC